MGHKPVAKAHADTDHSASVGSDPAPTRWRILPLALVLVLVGACCAFSPSPDQPKSPADRWIEASQVEKTVDRAAACPAWRRVGRLAADREKCPAAEEPWTTSRLFPNHEPPSALARYCLYEYPGTDPSAIGPPADSDHLDELQADCVGLVPQSTEAMVDPAVERILESRFLHYVGSDDDDALPYRRVRPRLAILDTTPTDADRPQRCVGESRHGDTLIHMADRLLCRAIDGKSADCAAEITSRLALPWMNYSPEEDQLYVDPEPAICDEGQPGGGRIGSIAGLAVAIDAEVETWLAVDSDVRPPLILNLSVGWDGELFGGHVEPGERFDPKTSKIRPAVSAVYDALMRAHDLGVLVFAAAGNSSWGPEPGNRAVLPAGWESLRTDQPLVYAVGGLRSHKHALINARGPATWASLMAFGDHATVRAAESYSEPKRTAVLTGTSVSTVVASSAAALIWGQDPSLTPQEVVDAMRKPRDPFELSQDAEIVQYGKDKISARRVRLCHFLTGRCDHTEPFPIPNWPVSPSTSSAAMSATSSSVWLEACGETLHYDGKAPAPNELPCPHRQLPNAQSSDGTHPQPGSDICPSCPIKPENLARLTSGSAAYKVHFAFDPEALDLGYSSTVFLNIGNWTGKFDLESTGLSFTAPLPQAAIDQFATGAPALVSMRASDDRSLVSPMLVF